MPTDAGSNYRTYLSEINRIPVLTREEEIALAIRAENGDMEARNRMIECNLRLVVVMANRYSGMGMDINDLIESGNEGLIKAVDRFDWKKGNKFCTYATWWIREEILHTLTAQSQAMPLPPRMHSRMKKVQQSQAKLHEAYGRQPTNTEIADDASITTEQVADTVLFMQTQNPQSLDDTVFNPYADDTNVATIGDMVAADMDDTPDRAVDSVMLTEKLRGILSNFSPRERVVLKLYFGLVDGRTRTLDVVGKDLNVVRERVRQLLSSAKTKLHDEYGDDLHDYYI